MAHPAVKTAQAHIQKGNLEQARSVLAQALTRAPADAEMLALMAWTLLQQGRVEQARYYAQRACELRPGDADAWFNLGKVMVAGGQTQPAVDAFRKAVAADPDRPETLGGLTNALYAAHHFEEAAALSREGLKRWPGHAELLTDLALALTCDGRAEEAVPVAREAAMRHPDHVGCVELLPFVMNYAAGLDPRDVLEAHRAYGRMVERAFPAAPTPAVTDRDPERRLRIALLSGDLRNHAVASFIEPFMEHHDRAVLDLTCYSTAAVEDSGSQRLRRHAAAWHAVGHLGIPALADRIRGDRIDILIDLSGHMAGNRLQVFALHPAPIGVTGFGYPNTTGVRGVDYRLVDSVTDPVEGWYDSLATEKLWRLDPCFTCYRPVTGAPEPSAPPPGAPFTFGSFNNIAKQVDASLDLYRRVLDAVPGSRLLLKYITLEHEAARESLRRRCAAAGLDPTRVIVDTPEKTSLDVLGAYGRMDVMLDSFPYNGTTTTCEALYMGVPVVTLAGRVSAARVGASLLTNVGLGDLAADTPERYAAIAAGLVLNRTRLDSLRSGLRSRLLASPVCDGPGFTRRLEAALRGMWREWCKALA